MSDCHKMVTKLLILFSFVLTVGGQSVRNPIGNVTGQIGQSAALVCDLTNVDNAYDIYWYRQDRRSSYGTLSLNAVIFPGLPEEFKSRLSVRCDRNRPNDRCSLTISSLMLTDTDPYGCGFMDTVGRNYGMDLGYLIVLTSGTNSPVSVSPATALPFTAGGVPATASNKSLTEISTDKTPWLTTPVSTAVPLSEPVASLNLLYIVIVTPFVIIGVIIALVAFRRKKEDADRNPDQLMNTYPPDAVQRSNIELNMETDDGYEMMETDGPNDDGPKYERRILHNDRSGDIAMAATSLEATEVSVQGIVETNDGYLVPNVDKHHRKINDNLLRTTANEEDDGPKYDYAYADLNTNNVAASNNSEKIVHTLPRTAHRYR